VSVILKSCTRMSILPNKHLIKNDDKHSRIGHLLPFYVKRITKMMTTRIKKTTTTPISVVRRVIGLYDLESRLIRLEVVGREERCKRSSPSMDQAMREPSAPGSLALERGMVLDPRAKGTKSLAWGERKLGIERFMLRCLNLR
jgi:hypothetical protein